jgi:hypothetical protein
VLDDRSLRLSLRKRLSNESSPHSQWRRLLPIFVLSRASVVTDIMCQSLPQVLDDRSLRLSLRKRLGFALDVAEGMLYLHTRSVAASRRHSSARQHHRQGHAFSEARPGRAIRVTRMTRRDVHELGIVLQPPESCLSGLRGVASGESTRTSDSWKSPCFVSA